MYRKESKILILGVMEQYTNGLFNRLCYHPVRIFSVSDFKRF